MGSSKEGSEVATLRMERGALGEGGDRAAREAGLLVPVARRFFFILRLIPTATGLSLRRKEPKVDQVRHTEAPHTPCERFISPAYCGWVTLRNTGGSTIFP